MRAFTMVGVGVLAAAASFGLAAQAGGDASQEGAPAQAACGAPGRPPCPLQGWMRARVAAPLAANNGEALATGLEQTSKLQPDPTWASWSRMAVSGAEAARKGDLAGARASCKSCHDAWREAYKTKFRTRPVPP